MADERVYTSSYSGQQIDDGIAAIPQLTQRIVDIEKSIAGEGDAGIGNTIGTLNTRITNNTNAILEIKEDLLPAKVNLSDYNNRVGGIETQVHNLNADFGTLEGKVNLKADSATLIATKSELQTSISNLDKAYKQADTQLDGKIDDVNTSLIGTISDLSSIVSGHSTKITEMENKVNSAPTEGNFASINDKIAALETNKADKTELQAINSNYETLTGNFTQLGEDINNNSNNITLLTQTKTNQTDFNELVSRVTTLEGDTTTEGLTSQIEELQGSIRDILADLEVIKADIAALKEQNPTT